MANKKRIVTKCTKMWPQMKFDLTYWESKAPVTDARVEEIDYFDARGMRRVYGRGDHYGRHWCFNMNIWKTHDRRLLARFWSRCDDIDGRSFEIKGIDTAAIPRRNKQEHFQDSWVPKAIRKEYDQWIRDEF